MKILVTGANQGIGFYFVRQLLEDGHQVAVFDKRIDKISELKMNFYQDLIVCQVDVRNDGALQKAVEVVYQLFGEIDVAVHNACCCLFQSANEMTMNNYRTVFDVNYYGALHLLNCVLPSMIKQKQGKIIFTCSGVGVTGFPGLSAYASSKAALETLAKCLNLEYASAGVSFHLMHPPLTRTASSKALPVPSEMMASPKMVGRGLAKKIDSKRFIICHNVGQWLQMALCYHLPCQMGRLMAMMTRRAAKNKATSADDSVWRPCI